MVDVKHVEEMILEDVEAHRDFIDAAKVVILFLVQWISAGAMVFGGVVPYIPQYRTIARSGNTDGFSPMVCFVLLMANSLRILFWFGKHFELPLLAQSFIMVVAMIAMVELCARVRSKQETATKEHNFLDFDLRYFWRWSRFSDFLQCILAIWLTLSYVTWLFLGFPWYVETLGFLAVFIEAMIGAPQFLKNYQNKSTLGMSVHMVLMWTSGDCFKTMYFILNSAPPQFWICGLIQIGVDVSILGQVWYYSIPKYTISYSKPRLAA